AQQPFVAVDTEFMRETTYWPKLCLIQAAAPGVEAVIDPLAEGLALAPFMELMANEKVLKVFHASRQDLEIFLKIAGKLPHPVFDTQIAAMACGYGDTVAYLLDPAIYDTTPENSWNRLKLRKTTADYVLGLQVAAAWRERQAQQRDVPRGRIVKDEALYEIAEQRPKNAADFDRMRAVPRGFGNSRAATELIQALERAFNDPNRPVFKYDRPPPLPSGLGRRA
ncbi:MAG: HRDC domain-containing protein, partial [Terricaulis sp.]